MGSRLSARTGYVLGENSFGKRKEEANDRCGYNERLHWPWALGSGVEPGTQGIWICHRSQLDGVGR